MYLDVYVGRLDNPEFLANKDRPGGSVPPSAGPVWPFGRNAFSTLVQRIETKRWPGGATQHIAYVSPASKDRILEFFDELWQEERALRQLSDYEVEARSSTRRWIESMVDDGQWCLVASE